MLRVDGLLNFFNLKNNILGGRGGRRGSRSNSYLGRGAFGRNRYNGIGQNQNTFRQNSYGFRGNGGPFRYGK